MMVLSLIVLTVLIDLCPQKDDNHNYDGAKVNYTHCFGPRDSECSQALRHHSFDCPLSGDKQTPNLMRLRCPPIYNKKKEIVQHFKMLPFRQHLGTHPACLPFKLVLLLALLPHLAPLWFFSTSELKNSKRNSLKLLFFLSFVTKI